ncbi:MAG: sensor histidine kinase [Clostridiales bacterium]|nr:sensor histidine kinase [Clostridiales bacterium]
MTLRELCNRRTALTDEDIGLLELYETALPAIADLLGTDVFLDCLDTNGTAFVASHRCPKHIPSQYRSEILGLDAGPDNEPAVYRAFEQGLPFHDTVANTQENKTVLQDVTPVFGSSGVIAVLISERDISRQVQMEKKLQVLSETMLEQTMEDAPSDASMSIRESNHRIKNSLQLLASICNLKGRQSDIPEVKEAYSICSGTLLSVSRLHELFSETQGMNHEVSLDLLLGRIVSGIREAMANEMRVCIRLECEPARVDPDTASSVTLCVNELIFNALKYAFDGSGGSVSVRLTRGNRYYSIVVEDDGKGADTIRPGTGLSIIRETVRGKLGGELTMSSGSGGTKVAFTFPIQ